MELDLKIKIPKRFEEGLRKRLDLRRAKRVSGFDSDLVCIIREPCPLCPKYNNCRGCPFNKYKTKERQGCMEWFMAIYPTEEGTGIRFYANIVIWSFYYNKAVHAKIKKMKRKAEKLITWV